MRERAPCLPIAVICGAAIFFSARLLGRQNPAKWMVAGLLVPPRGPRSGRSPPLPVSIRRGSFILLWKH